MDVELEAAVGGYAVGWVLSDMSDCSYHDRALVIDMPRVGIRMGV